MLAAEKDSRKMADKSQSLIKGYFARNAPENWAYWKLRASCLSRYIQNAPIG